MDLVVSPTTVALNPQLGAAVPPLKAGDIIEAQVLALLGDGRARLAIANTILEVQTKVALTPGTIVRLAVKNTPDGIRLTIVGNPTAAPVSSPTTAAAATPAGPAQATPAGANETAVVQTAGQGATASTGAPSPPASNPSAALPRQDSATAPALTLAVQAAAARQNGLAPLFADVGAAATMPALPESVRQAADHLLALRPALAETLSAADVKQAVARSGLFLEARLSAAVSGAAPEPGASDDLKAALILLRHAIKIWLAPERPDGRVVNAAAGASAEVATEHLANAPAIAPGAPEPGADPTRAPASVPPPPYRGAAPAAQAAVAPSIAPDMAPRAIGRILLADTDAAIARQTLLQAASLPDQAEPGVREGPRWHFEVPFATPHGGTAVAQFEIARDGRHAPAEGSKPVWRARFSLDVEPIGPVHAQIALVGTRAAVTLWAERPDTSAQLRDQARELADALRAAEIEPGDVLVRYGAPPRPREAAASGRFLDRAS